MSDIVYVFRQILLDKKMKVVALYSKEQEEVAKTKQMIT